MIKLAILICTMPKRKVLLDRLCAELERQIGNESVHLIINDSKGLTGGKRNENVQDAVRAGALAIAHHDDDDYPGETYIKRGLEFADSGMDCAELWGQIYFGGKPGNPFHHYINCVNPATKKIEWWQDNAHYARMINHLNFQKTSLVKDIPFPDKVFGEDGVQSERMRDAKIFKTMYPIPEIIYNYLA